MAGIAGIIASSSETRSALDAMVTCMVREPFDVAGQYRNEQLGFATGWVSHTGSSFECLPIWNECKDICLIFSGENFEDPADVRSLSAKGHSLEPDNGSYLVHLYEEMGIKFLENLNGWFSGVLVNLREEKIVLFNDRYGLGRIYFHENADGFFFASKAKSLLKVLPDLRRIDSTGLAEWFTCGCAMQNRTLFRGISLLPGGSVWSFGVGDAVKASYFRREVWENQSRLDEESYYRELRHTFSRVLPHYFQGSQRIGMSLTGGLDGRMIMAWARRASGDLPCYTFNSCYRDCADVRIARRVARECDQPHQIIPVGEEFLRSFPALAEKTVYITDGAMDVSGAAELYVNHISRKIAPVRLTGNYGSEILRNNVAFRPNNISEYLFDSDFAPEIRRAPRTYLEEARGNRRSFIAFKQVPWHHFGRFAVEQSQLTVRSPFLDNKLVALAFRAPTRMETSVDLSLRLISDGSPQLARIPTDRGVRYSANDGLNRLRRTMAELLAKTEYGYDYGMPQWLAGIDHLLAPLKLERLFLGRQKFCHFRIWYRDRLAPYVKEILLDPRSLSRPYLNGRRVEQIVTEHLHGNRNYTSEITLLLTSELMHRQLFES